MSLIQFADLFNQKLEKNIETFFLRFSELRLAEKSHEFRITDVDYNTTSRINAKRINCDIRFLFQYKGNIKEFSVQAGAYSKIHEEFVEEHINHLLFHVIFQMEHELQPWIDYINAVRGFENNDDVFEQFRDFVVIVKGRPPFKTDLKPEILLENDNIKIELLTGDLIYQAGLEWKNCLKNRYHAVDYNQKIVAIYKKEENQTKFRKWAICSFVKNKEEIKGPGNHEISEEEYHKIKKLIYVNNLEDRVY